MHWPGKKVICPYCFERFPLQEVHFRCMNPNQAECPREEDPIFARYLQLANSLQKRVVVPSWGSWIKKLWWSFAPPMRWNCDAPKCGHVTTQRICPRCHNELPNTTGIVKNYVLAVIGGRNTGKSHFIATVIDVLKNQIGSQFDAALYQVGDETISRYRNEFWEPLYMRKEFIEATQAANVNLSVKQPMIFRLVFRRKGYLGFGTASSITLVFFDTAGEDLKSLTNIMIETKYICRASGIIFLLDPLQIPAVRNQLPSSVDLPPMYSDADPSNIVSRLLSLFQQVDGLKPDQKIKVPVAFCFSKLDAIKSLLEPGSRLPQPGSHNGYFDEDDADSIHTEIWNHLQNWMGSGFNQQIDLAFKAYHYFGFSAIGNPPVSKGRLDVIKPLRVEDPLLWLLAQLKLIPSRKTQK